MTERHGRAFSLGPLRYRLPDQRQLAVPWRNRIALAVVFDALFLLAGWGRPWWELVPILAAFPLLVAGGMLLDLRPTPPYKPGQEVVVKATIHSGYAGMVGVVTAEEPDRCFDVRVAFPGRVRTVNFENDELEPSRISTHTLRHEGESKI